MDHPIHLNARSDGDPPPSFMTLRAGDRAARHAGRRRLILGLALLPAAGIAAVARADTETRSVAGFDEVVFAVAGRIEVTQGGREGLLLDAEPQVLRQITTEVRDRRLVIGLAPGRIETRQPIRMKLHVRALKSFEVRTSAEVHMGPLSGGDLALALNGGGSIRIERLAGRHLDVRIAGAGDIAIDGGEVMDQRIDIAGMGGYVAPTLACASAEVAIAGNGNAHLAASRTLAVRIGGIGQVRYRGNPAVTRQVGGIGTVERDG